MKQWLTQVQIVVYFGVEAQITNIRQSQKEEPSWGTQEEFLPEQGNGSVSLPPIVSNIWQQVSLQIQHKITLQKQLKRCFRCLAMEGADNGRNFQLLRVEDLEQKIRFVFSGTKKFIWVSHQAEKHFEYWGKPKLLICAKGLKWIFWDWTPKELLDPQSTEIQVKSKQQPQTHPFAF